MYGTRTLRGKVFLPQFGILHSPAKKKPALSRSTGVWRKEKGKAG
jgi:hypothetical protein